MEKIWIKKELYILNYEFMKFMPFSDFYIILNWFFLIKKITKRGIYLQVVTWRAGLAASWHVARGTTARMRRDVKATWQGRESPTRGAGGPQDADTWQEATRVHGSTRTLVWGATW